MSRVDGSLGLIIVLLVPLVVLTLASPVGAAPEGQVVWAAHASLVPTWFDPAEMIQGTVFMVLYAMHDAVVKPMPGKSATPSLAESWTVSPDGLVYEFVLRKGARFHNGEAVTSEDVKVLVRALPKASSPSRSRTRSPRSRRRTQGASGSA